MSLEKLKKIGDNKEKPLLCLEVNPPRGVDLETIFARLESKVEGVDFFNVTDSALARMRLAPLPFASILKQRYNIEPLVNISCRDRNLIAIQGDLLSGWVTGVRSVVALTGDAVSVGDSPDSKGVFEVNSIGLLKALTVLNGGKDLAGNKLKGAPEYYPGVVVNPNARNSNAELKKLTRKRDAGAKYALSQPVFDEESSAVFFEKAKECGVPIFMGLLPLSTVRSARAIENVPGIRLSESFLGEIEGAAEDRDLKEFSMDLCLKLAKRNRGNLCGFHVISGTTPKLALRLAGRLAQYIGRG